MMASSASKACSSGVIILVLMQCIASVVLVEGDVPIQPAPLTLTIKNGMTTVGQRLALHCHFNGKDLGQLSEVPFNQFSWTFTTNSLGTDVFTCTFATYDKPTTTIDLFRGFSFRTSPCSCLGLTQCFWQAMNDGFWCNSKFIQKWSF